MNPTSPKDSMPIRQGTSITYDALRAQHTQRMQEDGAKDGMIRNAQSALNRFLKVAGLPEGGPVGLELGPLFAEHLERHLATQSKQSSKNNARHLMQRWRKTFLDMQADAGLPPDFAGALKRLMENAGASIRRTAAAIGSTQDTIAGWMKGQNWPNLRMMPKIVRLEGFLNAPTGCLTARLRKVRTKTRVTGGTQYREKLLDLKEKLYALRPQNWPQALTTEFKHLVEFKSTAFLPDGVHRNKPWTIKNGKCPTAGMARELFARFFGWLLLPPDAADPALRGRGMRVEDLSLALLTHPALAREFLEFLKIRSGGHTGLAPKFLELLFSLCREDTGYFPQHIEYAHHPITEALLPTEHNYRGKKIPLHTIPDRWAAWCSLSADTFMSHRRTIREFVAKGRDPAEPIQPILNLERPMSALFDIIDGMRGALPPVSMSSKTRAVAFRDRLMVELLVSNPLRIGMFSIMKYRENQTGNLYRREDGNWRLRYRAEDFKNARVGAAKTNYDVRIHKGLWPLIEEYLQEHRPHLMGADTCDYVFRPSPRCPMPTSNLPGPNAPMDPGTLSEIVRLASHVHLPNSCGFGAHAIRHIVATHLIKTDPIAGWMRAAYALHDQESTVRRAYAHLQVEEAHEIWHAAYEQIRTAHETARGEFSASYAEMLPVLRGFLDRGITDLRQLVAEIAVRADVRSKAA